MPSIILPLCFAITTVPLPPPEMAGLLAVVFVSTLFRFTFGFGDALLAMPLLSLFLPLGLAAPLVAAVSLSVAVAILAREWRSVDVRGAALLVAFALMGLPLGSALLGRLDESAMKTALAVVVFAFGAYGFFHPRLLRLKSDATAPLFGFLAGLLGGAYNTHGPPIVVFGALRSWSPERFRATLQGYFLPAGLATVALHAWHGRYTPQALGAYLWAAPALGVSLCLAPWLYRWVRRRNFNRWLYAALMAIGALLLVAAWMSRNG